MSRAFFVLFGRPDLQELPGGRDFWRHLAAYEGWLVPLLGLKAPLDVTGLTPNFAKLTGFWSNTGVRRKRICRVEGLGIELPESMFSIMG